MLLSEFTDDDQGALVVAADRLLHDLDIGKISGEWDVDQLLDYLEKYDIIRDVDDLPDMIKKPPFNKIIANIQGDKIVWRGAEMPITPNNVTDQNEKTVKQMAKRAVDL